MSAAAEVIIREARPEDAPQIARVHIRTWQSAYQDIFPAERLRALADDLPLNTERWQASLSNPEQLPAFFIAQAGPDEIIGFAAAGQQPKPEYPYNAELFMIYILPEYQQRGVGRRLTSAVAAKLKTLGFSSLMLWVLEENPASRAFYHALGGKQVGRDHYLRWGQTCQLVAYAWDSLDALLQP